MVYKLFIDFFSPLIKRHDIQICSPGSWAPSQNICGENIKNKKSQKCNFLTCHQSYRSRVTRGISHWFPDRLPWSQFSHLEMRRQWCAHLQVKCIRLIFPAKWPHTWLGHQQRHQVDVLLGDVVIQQHPDGHHGGGPRGHGGVHQDHLVVLDVLITSRRIKIRG